MSDPPPFGWTDAEPTESHTCLVPALLDAVRQHPLPVPATILDLGCGNGYVSAVLAREGYQVTGVDVDESGIALGRQAHPGLALTVCSLYDARLPERVGTGFDAVVSLEVIEHLPDSGALFDVSRRLLKPGGLLVLSTPYHGYLKNLALALLNGWDRHLNPGRPGGHVQFFSRKTLTSLAIRFGFKVRAFRGVGRAPGLWKSMLLSMTTEAVPPTAGEGNTHAR
jgi:SAM-dependent methyltransferase